jgi:hypothetical protein
MARFRTLPPGPLELRASSDRHLGVGPVVVESAATAVVVHLKRGLAIVGRVVAPDGAPVPDADVNG